MGALIGECEQNAYCSGIVSGIVVLIVQYLAEPVWNVIVFNWNNPPSSWLPDGG